MLTRTIDELLRENQELRNRLDEAEQALRAIRAGEVDAVFIEAEREQVYTLETAEYPYRLLVARVPQAAATLTADGLIICCNRRFADLLGRPVASLQGKPIGDFVARESRAALATLLQDGSTGEAQDAVTLLRDDGTPVSLYLGVSPLREGALGQCLMVTDMTEHRHYEDLRLAQQALRDADRRKDEFVATLAHELRNPLAPIRNAVQLLISKGQQDPDLDWARAVIDRQVQIMARLLDDLLDVSRISRNELELRKSSVDLAAVVESAVETSRPVVEAGRHQLVVALPRGPIRLTADPVRLAQVFANLLTNAAKYTPEGGHIRLAAERQGDDVIVSVQDSGIGLAADVLPHVFEIFSQAKSGRGQRQGGLGIGLSLVKWLVELHGGHVEARSAGPGQGSEFVVRLPVATENLVADAPPKDHAARPPVRKRRILIADDNRDSADSMAMLLQTYGHEVATAYNGEQAVELATSLRPDVALLDIGMPQLDGYETGRRIREHPCCRNVFLIAMTGWGQEEDRRRTDEAGFDHHVVKPVEATELIKLLEALPDGRPLTEK
ncbi:MAG TPA: ATP-binding protein [Gemmataceae bacterium]|nr:ATP-binding protein [Gemmataceae bacterium]